MQITYDKSSDAAYIELTRARKSKAVLTDSFELQGLIPFGDINLDFNEDNFLIGIEILNASKYLLPELINDENSNIKAGNG